MTSARLLALPLVVGCFGSSAGTDRHFDATLLDERERHQEAIEMFSRLIESDPEHQRHRHGRAVTYIHLGDYESAMTDLDEAIRLDPAYFPAHFARGTLNLTEFTRYDRAIRDFEHAIEHQTRFPAAHHNRGVAYNALGNRARACVDWRTACEQGLDVGCEAAESMCGQLPDDGAVK